MWSIAGGIVAAGGVVISKALPYLFSATLGALAFKQSEPIQSYSGSHGILIHGTHAVTHIHQIQEPTALPATTSRYNPIHSLFLAGGSLVFLYCIAIIKRGEHILSSPDSWATWLRYHSYNDEDLLYEVHVKYCENEYNQLEPCIAALNDIIGEKEMLQNYLSLRSFIAKTPLTMFFRNHILMQEQAQTSIEQLNTLSHYMLTWTQVFKKKNYYEKDNNVMCSPE
ncbi:hypothetical protein JW872_01370 [Candidatus Babeliales bacterium]|nr:hypothetical protein [Candidatus Babeliales bacterium]